MVGIHLLIHLCPIRTKCRISDIGKYYIMYCAYMGSKLGILIGTYSPNHQSIGLFVIHHFSETIRKNNKIIISMNINYIFNETVVISQ